MHMLVDDALDIGRKATQGDCVYFFQTEGPRLDPKLYNPLIPIFGGHSFLPLNGKNGAAGTSLLIANAWINQAIATGGNTEDAIVALAANWSEHPGMVAMALETAMVAYKDKTPRSIRLTDESYARVVHRVYKSNLGGIYDLMSDRWRVGVTANARRAAASKRIKCRKEWRDELGHDVLIHPVSLEPCRDESGILAFEGAEGPLKAARMKFRRANGQTFMADTFPATAA